MILLYTPILFQIMVGVVHWGNILADFIGRYLNRVDSKGRVSVPAAWRPRLTREDFSGIIAQTGIPEKAIDAYPRDYLEIIQTKLDQKLILILKT